MRRCLTPPGAVILPYPARALRVGADADGVERRRRVAVSWMVSGAPP
jgi:hypothetical protein